MTCYLSLTAQNCGCLFSAMPFIDGTEVDYVREGLNQIFKFHNPKAQNECGCGESFGV